jgi:exopolysaccharide production protein ExoZ
VRTALVKIRNIQALRGVAVLSVVLFHLAIIEQKYGGAKTILPDMMGFGIFGVDLFFVISGFVIVTVTRGQFQDARKALKFLYHRVSRIYPAYWVYSLLVLGIFLYNPLWVNSSQGNRVHMISSFLLIPSGTLPLVMVGWTLEHELYFYVTFFLIMMAAPERYMPFLLLCWGAGVASVNWAVESPGPFAALACHPLTLEFIGGCFLASICFRKGRGGMKNPALLILASAVLITAMLGYHAYEQLTGQADPQGWWRILIFGVPALLVVYCFVGAERNGYVAPASLIMIGDASYSIYLSHVLTMSAAGRIWGHFSNDALYDNAVMTPILIILVMAVGIFSYRFIEKPLLVYSRRIA